MSRAVFGDKQAEYGIIVEKNYTLQIVYEFLQSHNGISEIEKVLNPIWGEEIIYFEYYGKSFVVLNAVGAPVAVNAIERMHRSGVKYIVAIGTCGSMDKMISNGTIILSDVAVRDEFVSTGYFDLRVPAYADRALLEHFYQKLCECNVAPLIGGILTTDKRYLEQIEELIGFYQHAGIVCVDMEVSAILLVSRFYNIRCAVANIVMDCAAQKEQGGKIGVFDRDKDYISFIKPKLIVLLHAALETLHDFS